MTPWLAGVVLIAAGFSCSEGYAGCPTTQLGVQPASGMDSFQVVVTARASLASDEPASLQEARLEARLNALRVLTEYRRQGASSGSLEGVTTVNYCQAGNYVYATIQQSSNSVNASRAMNSLLRQK